MKILIAGCGYVGSALARLLVADGHTVWGLRRNVDALPEGVRPLAADLFDPATLRTLPRELDFVFYTAGSSGFTDDAYRTAYVDGPNYLLKALAEGGTALRRLFFTSSTGVYAQNNGEWVDEESPVEPVRFSGKRLVEAESVFHRSLQAATVVRLGGIYGPGRTRLIDQVRSGEAYRAAGRVKYLNLIHLDDCAGVLRHLMTVPNPAGCYVAVDNEPVEKNELLQWTAAQLGLPPLPVKEVAEAQEPQRGGNRRIRNARLLSTGYEFTYPTYREGYRALLGHVEIEGKGAVLLLPPNVRAGIRNSEQNRD